LWGLVFGSYFVLYTTSEKKFGKVRPMSSSENEGKEKIMHKTKTKLFSSHGKKNKIVNVRGKDQKLSKIIG